MPSTATLTLHPINHGFPNDTDGPMETWVFSPDHVPSLLRGEYKFLRIHGTAREAARWHCHRMIAMMGSVWIAERIDDDLAWFAGMRYETIGVIENGRTHVDYESCVGCGRLFKTDSQKEMRALAEHDCDWDDNELDDAMNEF